MNEFVRRPASMALFQVQPPGALGPAFSIRKDASLPSLLPNKLEWLSQREGDLTENLMACAVDEPEVQVYLASDEGKDETQRWVNYIKENGTPA